MSNTLSNYAFNRQTTEEIVCAYITAAYEPTPSAANAPWVVIGSFAVSAAVRGRLVICGLNSGPAALLVRLYADGVGTDCVSAITSPDETTTRSDPYGLLTGVIYQLAVQYEGAASSAVVRSVTLGEV
jgi:hypothetical protein